MLSVGLYLMTTEIHASVDNFAAPTTLRGWATKRQDGALMGDLRIEAWRAGEIIAVTRLTGPRPDVTGDEVTPAAFSLICPEDVTIEQLLTDAVTLRAVDESGEAAPIPIWDQTRNLMRQQLLRDTVLRSDAGLALEMLKTLSDHAGLIDEAPQVRDISRKLAQIAALGQSNARTHPKIVFVGAGSTVFTKNLIGDLLLRPALRAAQIVLYDIDGERLRVSEIIANRIRETLSSNATIEATLDLGEALDGADFALTMIQVGGYQPGTVTDFEIPKRFGLRQTIGDTVGVGGIMRGLRTIPALLRIVQEMERRCPAVIHLNYSNPMAMNCWALSRSTSVRTIGLCHSVPLTAAEMARDIGVDAEDVSYLVAGINHMAFFLEFKSRGEDLYPKLFEHSRSGNIAAHNQIRYDVLRRLGYFVTESSEHFAEYVPWYIKRGQQELIHRFNIPLDEYPRRCRQQIADWDQLAVALLDPETRLDIAQTDEYASVIINAIVTGEPTTIYGNVPNTGLITNLPSGCCVEVSCLVDQNGVRPLQLGALPPQLAALMQTNINVQALTVEAALSGRRDHVYHAAMLDPHTASDLNLDQIWDLVDTMLSSHRELLPPDHFR